MNLRHTITVDDVGRIAIKPSFGVPRIWVDGFMGRIQPQDVGKRIYDVDGVYQVENQEQLEARQ